MPSSTATRVIKNTGYLYAKMGITMFISLYTTRLILNSLGASDFGIFNIVGGAIAMLGFLNGAMASATQRFMSYSEGEGNKEKQKSIFNVSLVLHFGIAFIVGIVLLIAGYFFFNGILNIPVDRIFAAKVVYASLIVSTMFTVMTVPYDAAMNAHENMKYYAIVGILESFLKLAVAFACVYTSYDKLIVYGSLMACIPLITLTIMRVYCHKHYEECSIRIKKYWDKRLMKEMTSFAGWNFSSVAIIMISAQGQGVVLNHFFGTILNAAQGISSQVNGQLQILSSNMLKALNPILGKSAGAKNEELLIKSTLFGAKYSTALYLLVTIPFFIETPYILKIWLKEIPEWTIIFVRFQLIKTFIEFQFGTFPTAISATGHIRKYTIWSCLFNFFQLPVMYLLFKVGMPPYFLYITSIIFGNVLVYIAAILFTKKLVGISIIQYVQKVTLPLYETLALSIMILYMVEQFIQINSIFKLLIFILLAVMIFSIAFFFIGCGKQEKQILYTIKAEILNKIHKNV
ncbi:hypothetical protein [Phocaeicola salanitronis]|uniref:hypothetical protein n=1 Tax=Phocaeicola salanitronis TaxID=376805 RepID=UPI0023F8C106|nr:hypothetical protein [Phocaeicola salanitronis]